MEYKALAQRTAMVGGRTSYSVYVDKKQKNFHPLYGSRYATTHSGSSLAGECYQVRDYSNDKDRHGTLHKQTERSMGRDNTGTQPASRQPSTRAPEESVPGSK
jgi:hypothetical protein